MPSVLSLSHQQGVRGSLHLLRGSCTPLWVTMLALCKTLLLILHPTLKLCCESCTIQDGRVLLAFQFQILENKIPPVYPEEKHFSCAL